MMSAISIALLLLAAAMVNSTPTFRHDNTAGEMRANEGVKTYMETIGKLYQHNTHKNAMMDEIADKMDTKSGGRFVDEMQDYLQHNSKVSHTMDETEDKKASEKYMDEIKEYFQHASPKSYDNAVMQDYKRPMQDTKLEGEKDNEKYLDEVKEYFRHASPQSYDNAVMQDSRRPMKDPRPINSGDTVAFQTFVRDHWLGCVGSRCGRANCPLLTFSGDDWNKCYGEVFEIYRAAGPGNVRVGDLVGLHYPRERGTWMGCPDAACDKDRCPGHPTKQFGFADKERWFHCYGEVFKIYSGEKEVGTVIKEFDDIFLFYLRGGLWVAQGFEHTTRLPCVGPRRPPPASVYDHCPWETFKIWKREY